MTKDCGASKVPMFRKNISQEPPGISLSVAKEVILENLPEPSHMFSSKPEWGCVVTLYDEGNVYFLKNADYTMGFSSSNGDALISVQKIYVSDNEIIIEDYPVQQLDKHGDFYLLSYKGE